MDYKSLMGYGKKKKVTKQQSKPKVNEVLNSIKEEFNLKEVGAAADYRPHIKKIDKLYHDYWDAVKDFTDLLLKKGVKKEANLLHKLYMKLVHTFHKKHFIKMIRKLI